MKNIVKFNFLVFGFIGVIHLLRVLTQFEVIVVGYRIPVWFNALLFLLAGWLAYENYKLYKGRSKKR
ncbi:MAG: hypothetical protein AABW58_04350 [Nanoarchaeota archaeon]